MADVVSGEVGAGDGDGCDGCRFGAEDAGTKGDGLPVVFGEEGDFFGGPAAFGAYGERGIGNGCDVSESRGEGGDLFGFA